MSVEEIGTLLIINLTSRFQSTTLICIKGRCSILSVVDVWNSWKCFSYCLKRMNSTFSIFSRFFCIRIELSILCGRFNAMMYVLFIVRVGVDRIRPIFVFNLLHFELSYHVFRTNITIYLNSHFSWMTFPIK